MTEDRFIRFVLPVIGTIFLIVFAALVVNKASFSLHASRANGHLLERDPHPLVRLSTPDGRTIIFRQDGNVSGPAGKPVIAAFDPADLAGTACVATVWALWGTILLLVPLGALASFVVGATMLRWV